MQKIKTALLSYGMSGQVFHAPFLSLHPGFELRGSWERSSQKIEEDYPGVRSYPSLDAVLHDDVDLVIVNTPVATHFDYAKRALKAGKHVLVEKAFTANAAEAEELEALAAQKGLKLCVFQNRRWDSDFQLVRNVLNEGVLGPIVEAELHFDRYNPNLSPKQHKETPNDGAGILKDLGSHLIDQALQLFGFPEGVFADLRVTRDESVVDDYIDVLLYYPQLRVRIKAGFFVMEPQAAYVLHGKRGSFLKARADVQEHDLKAGNRPTSHNWGYEPDGAEGILHFDKGGIVERRQLAAPPGNYLHFFEALYQSLIGQGEVPVPAADGVRTMRVIDAAILSNATKSYIPL